ncbi:hypothetical protein Z949_895 [Sulfitobacter guttiformis KCTC 32187]|nr:hypothetical protein Z949_895 [Sulfitobacter guttiformis KCTC 32187]
MPGKRGDLLRIRLHAAPPVRNMKHVSYSAHFNAVNNAVRQTGTAARK